MWQRLSLCARATLKMTAGAIDRSSRWRSRSCFQDPSSALERAAALCGRNRLDGSTQDWYTSPCSRGRKTHVFRAFWAPGRRIPPSPSTDPDSNPISRQAPGFPQEMLPTAPATREISGACTVRCIARGIAGRIVRRIGCAGRERQKAELFARPLPGPLRFRLSFPD